MKFTTLRNLMASMLVLGVAGSVIAVGNGTFALFNATTTNTGNTFASDDLIFTQDINGSGTTCSAQSSVSSGAASCGSIVTVSGNTLVPGDSKLGYLSLTNGSSQAAMSVSLSLSASPSTLLNTTTLNSGGLGLLIFRCENGSSALEACNGSSVTTLVPVYGSCGGNPSFAAGTGGITQSGVISSASTTGTSIPVGTTGQLNCTGGNTTSGISSVSSLNIGPDTVSTTSPTLGLNKGDVDYLAILVYFPGNAGNTLAASGTSTLTFTWTAEQIVGGPR